jgi:hypothetical protein
VTGLLQFLLLTCGFVLVVVGLARSYLLARQAIAPLVHQGDPTRAAIEALRPLPMRPRFRTAALRAVMSMAWLVISLYGLYFVVRAFTLTAP